MISEHITYKEATRSGTAVRMGIENIPDETELRRMKLVANKCFEPIRNHYGRPLTVTSFFRSNALNKEKKGSSTSQHCKGEAIDFDANSDNKMIFNWMLKNLEFDQLIWEYGDDNEPAWIHVSYTEQKPNRQEALRVSKDKEGNDVYTRLN
jgi:hypothetical protein